MAIPTKQELAKYNVVIPEASEGLQQSLYDFQAYAAAGSTQFTFFAIPEGQSSKTYDDTNLNLAGQLPKQQLFLIQSCEVVFYPTVPAVAADNPAAFGAEAVANIVNDAYAVYHAGRFELEIGSKNYLREAPLGRLPPKTHFQVNAAAADASTAAADLQTRIAFAYAAGRPYMLAAPLKLDANMNFAAYCKFATAVTITNPARIGVVLDGILYRWAQ